MNHILLSKINKRRISSGQAYLQPAANDQVEQDVMDDADGEMDKDGASEVVTREERTQLMAEVKVCKAPQGPWLW